MPNKTKLASPGNIDIYDILPTCAEKDRSKSTASQVNLSVDNWFHVCSNAPLSRLDESSQCVIYEQQRV